MSDESTDPGTDPADRLDERNNAVWELHEKCLYRSAVRVSREVRRAAVAERKLLPLLRANFHLMNAAQSTIDPVMGREAAVENIAYLESPDRARAFQGDLDEAAYEHTVQWMSSCSYDNLAVATALQQGYNSEGMQACVAGGIDVCRRTGKTECVACFREYAAEVHRAADDLDLALHFARANARAPASPSNDRRWSGADDECDLLLLAGQLEAAWEAGQRAWALVETHHSPLHARRRTGTTLAEVALVAGRDDWRQAVPDISADATPRGEDVLQDMRDDLVLALAASRGADPAKAAELLTYWDKWLADRQALHHWLEVRLRLVANALLAGQRPRAEALAKPLREKATAAADYLTLRRLGGLLDGSIPVLPMPLAAPPAQGGAAGGPEAGTGAAAAAATTTSGSSRSAGGTADRPPTPLREAIDGFAARLQEGMRRSAEAGEPPDFSDVLAEMAATAHVPASGDAAALLHLAGYAAGMTASADRDEQVWAWAEGLLAQHPQNGPVLNGVARLADVLREKDDSPLAERITAEQVGGWYKRSLDLDPNQPNGFARAGDFFLGRGDVGEAERCYARSFRLDRANAHVARRLARLYNQSDRPTDALAVLDMCLRDGGHSPELLWDAGLAAFGLGRHEAAVAYLDRLAEESPGRRWVHYYRAQALLDLNRPADALAAADAEAAVLDAQDPGPGEPASGERAPGGAASGDPPPTRLHVHCLRAAAAAGLNRPDAVRAHAAAAMAVKLSGIGDLSLSGIAANLRRLRDAVQTLPPGDPLRDQLDRLLLASGTMPDAFFDAARALNAKAENLSHFVVTVRQPLGANWAADPACLPGQDGWTVMAVRYGVLAADEAEARDRVLALHTPQFAAAAEVASVEPQGDGYHDHPGVTWQSYPEEVGGEGDDIPSTGRA